VKKKNKSKKKSSSRFELRFFFFFLIINSRKHYYQTKYGLIGRLTIPKRFSSFRFHLLMLWCRDNTEFPAIVLMRDFSSILLESSHTCAKCSATATHGLFSFLFSPWKCISVWPYNKYGWKVHYIIRGRTRQTDCETNVWQIVS
jgi:hypothetical protein